MTGPNRIHIEPAQFFGEWIQAAERHRGCKPIWFVGVDADEIEKLRPMLGVPFHLALQQETHPLVNKLPAAVGDEEKLANKKMGQSWEQPGSMV